ncbi:MAG: hypothetical protein PHC64_00660 [Candidatus Gastranaerophilales bacterium]|nr:hypothetical protein [Candidatus Gastranaerophilales bacterium]
MITRVSGLNTGSVVKDPRRKSQRMQFKNAYNVPYQSSLEQEYRQQQKNALISSISIVLGSVAFMIGYFLLSKKVRS